MGERGDHLVCRPLVLSLVVVLLLSAATTAISASGIRELNSTHVSGVASAGGSTEELASRTSPLLIRLRAATFDPLRGEPPLPTGLGVTSYPAGESGHFIVQFVGPVRAEWKEQLKQAGATMVYMSLRIIYGSKEAESEK